MRTRRDNTGARRLRRLTVRGSRGPRKNPEPHVICTMKRRKRRAPDDGSADFQSQRDCVFQPRVARNELPWALCRNPFGIHPLLVGCFVLLCAPFHLSAQLGGTYKGFKLLDYY